jgi:hypothetical protein
MVTGYTAHPATIAKLQVKSVAQNGIRYTPAETKRDIAIVRVSHTLGTTRAVRRALGLLTTPT